MVKEVHGAGGYGMLVGPASTKAEIEGFPGCRSQSRWLHCPAHAEPVHLPTYVEKTSRRATSTCARLCSAENGADGAQWPDPVALKGRLLVVNSSRGGGTRTPGFWSAEGCVCVGTRPFTHFVVSSAILLTPADPKAKMLSRTADHLFWMSRYTEQAENTARMLDVSYRDQPAANPPPWPQVGWEAC